MPGWRGGLAAVRRVLEVEKNQQSVAKVRVHREESCDRYSGRDEDEQGKGDDLCHKLNRLSSPGGPSLVAGLPNRSSQQILLVCRALLWVQVCCQQDCQIRRYRQDWRG